MTNYTVDIVTFRRQLIAGMSEKELLENVRAQAAAHHWLSYHTHRSDRSEPGFPDLVLVRPPHILWVELKRTTGRITPEQGRWGQALSACGGAYFIWLPENWVDGTIERILRDGPDPEPSMTHA